MSPERQPLSVSCLYGENDSEMTLETSSRPAAATARGSPTAARTAWTGTGRGRGRGWSGSAASPGTGGASTAGNPSPGTVLQYTVQCSTAAKLSPGPGTEVAARTPAPRGTTTGDNQLVAVFTVSNKYKIQYDKTSHQSPAFSLRTLSCSCILRLGWCASRDTRTPHWCGNMTWPRDT